MEGGREQSVGHELLIVRKGGKGSRRVRRDVVELYVGGQQGRREAEIISEVTGWRGRQGILLESRHNHPRVS